MNRSFEDALKDFELLDGSLNRTRELHTRIKMSILWHFSLYNTGLNLTVNGILYLVIAKNVEKTSYGPYDIVYTLRRRKKNGGLFRDPKTDIKISQSEL